MHISIYQLMRADSALRSVTPPAPSRDSIHPAAREVLKHTVLWYSIGSDSIVYSMIITIKPHIIYTYIYMYTYVIQIHAYIQTNKHTYIHACIHTYMHTYIHACIRTYVHTYIRTYVHTYKHTYIHIHTYVRMYERMYARTYVCMYVRTYIHTCMYAYIQTCTCIAFEERPTTPYSQKSMPISEVSQAMDKQADEEKDLSTFIHFTLVSF